jgi:UDP-3-O-[3-hydroxymyristoyl] N-acetylglucosamine deacetylase
MIPQRTLRKPVRLAGSGLHSGKTANVRIVPAAPNTGIVFVRTDVDGSPELPGHFRNVVSTKLATTLGRDKVTLSTVEHLMAALQGLGVDNARIEVDGPEMPILDGSALPFLQAIEKVGTEVQMVARPTLVLRRKVELKLKEKWAMAEPSARLEIHGSIEWDHPAIGYQEFHYIEGKTPFSAIADSRTFCLLRDVEAMKRMGLAQGGSLENAVVVDEARVVNPGGLRHPDEFVRHKVLDALGDLKLAGIQIQGYLRLHRAGHDLHSQLLAEIFSNPDNYEIIDAPATKEENRVASRLRTAVAGWAASF